MFAHVRTGLAWIIGAALPRLLPSDAVRRTGRTQPLRWMRGWKSKLAKEAVMYITGGIKVSVALIGTVRAPKEFAPFGCDPQACHQAEPQPFGPTAGTLPRSAMGIDFDAHHARCIRFLFGELIDFAFELIGLLAVESSRRAASLCIDHP